MKLRSGPTVQHRSEVLIISFAFTIRYEINFHSNTMTLQLVAMSAIIVSNNNNANIYNSTY